MTTLALCNNSFALQEKSSSPSSPPPNSPDSADVDDSYPQTASLQRPSYLDISQNPNEPLVNLTGDFIPLEVNRDRPPITRTASRQRSRNHISVNSESQHNEVHPPIYRFPQRPNQQFPSSPLAGSSYNSASEELVPLGEDDDDDEYESVHMLNMPGKRRLIFRIFFPEAFQNIMNATSTDAQLVLDTHARLPLNQTATLIEVLHHFKKNYPLDIYEPYQIHMPLRALALIINKILIARNVESLQIIIDSIEDKFYQIATSLAFPRLSIANPLPESDLEDAVEVLECELLRSNNALPYKLPLKEENISLINRRMEQNKATLNAIACYAKPLSQEESLDQEEPLTLALNRLVHKVRKQNVIYAVNMDNSLAIKLDLPGRKISLTPAAIKAFKSINMTHLQIATLPPSLISPALTTFLTETTEEVYYSTADPWRNIAQLLFDGIYFSKPFARKNDDTLRVLVQALSLLARVPPPVMPDTGLISFFDSNAASLGNTLSSGSNITEELLTEMRLPKKFSRQDKERENEVEEKHEITLIPSLPAVQAKLAILETNILYRLDNKLDGLLNLLPPFTSDHQLEEGSLGRYGPLSGTEEDDESDSDSDACIESSFVPE